MNNRNCKQVAIETTAKEGAINCISRIADTELVLMPERVAWWPAEQTLLLADSHFGKAATFRKAGIPVPIGTTQKMLAILADAVTALRPKRLLILGDFIHSVVAAQQDFEKELLDWRQEYFELPITLILGNHDRGRHQLFRQLRLDVRDQESVGTLHFCHDPFSPRVSCVDRFKVGGHIHPSVRLSTETRAAPCFWQGDHFLIFPAFGEFTGSSKISTGQRDILYPICNGQIVRVAANSLSTHHRRDTLSRDDSVVSES